MWTLEDFSLSKLKFILRYNNDKSLAALTLLIRGVIVGLKSRHIRIDTQLYDKVVA